MRERSGIDPVGRAIAEWVAAPGGRSVDLPHPAATDVIHSHDGTEIFEAVVEGRLRLVTALPGDCGVRTYRAASPRKELVDDLVAGRVTLDDAMDCGRISFILKDADGRSRIRDVTPDERPPCDGLADAARFITGRLPAKGRVKRRETMRGFAAGWTQAVLRTTDATDVEAEGACDDGRPPDTMAFRILAGGGCLSSIVFSRTPDGWWKVSMRTSADGETA